MPLKTEQDRITTLSAPRESVKRAAAALAAAVALVAAAACAPVARVTGMVAAPGTTRPGDLRGPFEGQVVDADSGEPLPGARVIGCWGFSRGVGLRAPAGTVVEAVRADADGRYRIARVDEVPEVELPGGASAELGSFVLIAHAPGYLGWRGDAVLPERGPVRPRPLFAQRGQRVELRRLRSDDSRRRHLAYLAVWGDLGGLGEELADEFAAAAAETRKAARAQAAEPGAEGDEEGEAAAAEGGEAAPPERAAPAIATARLLRPDDPRDVLGAAGLWEERALREPAGAEPATDSVHLRAVDRPESFDAALRAWIEGDGAEARYRDLLARLAGAAARDEIGDASFRALEGAILGVGWLDRARGAVLLLTCGRDLCADHDAALALARRVAARLGP